MPELLPSSVTDPWCALMLHHFCLVSHSRPPKLKSRRKFKSSPAPPPTASFHPKLVHDLNLASRLIHVCNNKSSQANRLRSQKTEDGFKVYLEMSTYFTLNISSSVEYHCIFRRNSKQNRWKGAAHLCNV